MKTGEKELEGRELKTPGRRTTRGMVETKKKDKRKREQKKTKKREERKRERDLT